MEKRSRVRRAAPILYLFVIAIAMTSVHVAKYNQLSPIDELRHVDYMARLTDFELVKLGDRLGQESLREEACRGADVPQPDPPCSTRHFNPRAFRDDGYQTASPHPPTYYAIVGFPSRVLEELGLFHSFIDPARLMGGVLLGFGLVFTYLAGVRLGVRRLALLAALTFVPTASAVLHANATVNPDASAVFAGGLVLLAAVLWEDKRIPLAALAGAGAFAAALKVTNLLIVFAVAAWLVLRSPVADRALDRVEGAWARSRFGRPSAPAADDDSPPEVTNGDAPVTSDDSPQRSLRVRAAVIMTASAVAVSTVWLFVDKLRATIDPSIVPQNKVLAANGFPAIGQILGPSLSGIFAMKNLFTWFPPVDGYDPSYFLNSGVFDFRVIAYLLLAGAMLVACLQVHRRDRVLQLAAVGTVLAVVGAPAFLLMNYFVSNVISEPNGRYGLALLPLMVVVLAYWVRGKGATVVLGAIAVAAFATQWFTILLADVPKPLVH